MFLLNKNHSNETRTQFYRLKAINVEKSDFLLRFTWFLKEINTERVNRLHLGTRISPINLISISKILPIISKTQKCQPSDNFQT